MEDNKKLDNLVEEFVNELNQTNTKSNNELAEDVALEMYRNIVTENVESSNIDSIGYLKESKILKVVFKGGTSYIYKNVDELQIKNINNAKSIGRYFNDNIKAFPEKYECIRL
ncbi:KTSC domain-containing protein [uncultured Clostridium sp.]|uniref:KTSC domain-containing protein n=1 Tax=uncultured Clostridium sp. TaxID=59620 RepID=UPI0026268E8F|nr:KTSC domain-containing protein [uncultured Clostridium sp.]